MLYLYLDESGDLGFDFVNKKPSKFFTVTILALSGADKNRFLINGVKHTLRRKLNKRTHRKRIIRELKGSETTLAVKEYFYAQLQGLKFGLYSLTLNKRRVYEKLTKEKARVYNYVARLVLDKIPFEKALTRVELIIDKSKSKPEIKEFNSYIVKHLEGRLDPKIPFDIYHKFSYESFGLQAADMFCWGIFRKYEKKDLTWFNIFATEKVVFDTFYLP